MNGSVIDCELSVTPHKRKVGENGFFVLNKSSTGVVCRPYIKLIRRLWPTCRLTVTVDLGIATRLSYYI